MRTFIAFVVLMATANAQNICWGHWLEAIQRVEVGNYDQVGPWPVGDSGEAIGPFQIHRIYWEDACQNEEYLRSTGYDYLGFSWWYGESVVMSYMYRYCPSQSSRMQRCLGTWADAERMSRVHNGGPTGHRKFATVQYWNKVKAELKKLGY